MFVNFCDLEEVQITFYGILMTLLFKPIQFKVWKYIQLLSVVHICVFKNNLRCCFHLLLKFLFLDISEEACCRGARFPSWWLMKWWQARGKVLCWHHRYLMSWNWTPTWSVLTPAWSGTVHVFMKGRETCPGVQSSMNVLAHLKHYECNSLAQTNTAIISWTFTMVQSYGLLNFCVSMRWRVFLKGSIHGGFD